MARIKYYYDTDSCKYERVKVSTSDIFLNSLGFLFVALLLAGLMVWLYTTNFDSFKEAQLKKENEELKYYNELHENEITEIREILTSLEERDDNIYRVIFGVDPVSSSIRKAGVGGSNRYKELLEKGLSEEQLILETTKKIDVLKKQMYVQTKSYDDIVKLAKQKEKLWTSIPAIQPIENQKLTRLASGYGMRIHPILHVMKMHDGVDLTAPTGTPIYATGDGVVKKVETRFGGYGKEVEIDHGFGYITKYAHMKKFNVKIGQKVKRGEVIGYVGSTGRSTAPHLHYEVIYKGKKVNPVHYFFKDLTPEEYEQILELASRENQSLS